MPVAVHRDRDGDADRVVAIVYALPWSAKKRRDFLLAQPEWYLAVEEVKDAMGEALLAAEWLSRLEGELLRTVFSGQDPMEAVPERVRPYFPDEVREELAELAGMAQEAA